MDTQHTLKNRIAELEAQLEALQKKAEWAVAQNKRIAELEAEVSENDAMMEIRRKRTIEADREWQQATGQHDVFPDLGTLIDWLRDRARQAEASEARLRTALEWTCGWISEIFLQYKTGGEPDEWCSAQCWKIAEQIYYGDIPEYPEICARAVAALTATGEHPDTERLDWLIGSGAVVVSSRGGKGFYLSWPNVDPICNQFGSFPDGRKAIQSAMADAAALADVRDLLPATGEREHPDMVSIEAVRDILCDEEDTWRNAGACAQVRETGVAAVQLIREAIDALKEDGDETDKHSG